jgi:hypothetical protein
VQRGPVHINTCLVWVLMGCLLKNSPRRKGTKNYAIFW